MNISEVIQNESSSLALVHQGTSLANIELLVGAWDSCALKAVTAFDSSSSLYLFAVKVSHVSASHIFQDALANNLIYVLVQCAYHFDLAAKLIAHPNPVVRTACAKHHKLACVLKTDENEYVRNACCQWKDILESIINDPSHIVRSRQIANSKKMALHYLEHGLLEDRILAVRYWEECRKIVLTSKQHPLYNHLKN